MTNLRLRLRLRLRAMPRPAVQQGGKKEKAEEGKAAGRAMVAATRSRYLGRMKDSSVY
jgi:hypothetical protein